MNIQLLLAASQDFSWIFDGIGTEIICVIVSLIVGSIGGGAIGYKIGTKNKNKQIQKAKDNANQSQIGSVTINNGK